MLTCFLILKIWKHLFLWYKKGCHRGIDEQTQGGADSLQLIGCLDASDGGLFAVRAWEGHLFLLPTYAALGFPLSDREYLTDGGRWNQIILPFCGSKLLLSGCGGVCGASRFVPWWTSRQWLVAMWCLVCHSSCDKMLQWHQFIEIPCLNKCFITVGLQEIPNLWLFPKLWH